MDAFPSSPDRCRSLPHRLALVIAIKLFALALIWWLCMDDQTVAVSDSSAASHFLGTPSPKE